MTPNVTLSSGTNPATNPPHSSHQNHSLSVPVQVLGGIFRVAGSAVIGGLAAYAFSIINPVGGAIFGATSALTSIVADKIANQFSINHTAVKVAVWIVSAMASIGIGLAVTTAVGFPLTVVGAIGMTAAMLATSIVVHLVAGIACCSTCLTLTCAGLAAAVGFGTFRNSNNPTH